MSNDNWIDVNDRLPDDESGYRVLVTANDIVSQWVEILNHNKVFWIIDGERFAPSYIYQRVCSLTSLIDIACFNRSITKAVLLPVLNSSICPIKSTGNL